MRVFGTRKPKAETTEVATDEFDAAAAATALRFGPLAIVANGPSFIIIEDSAMTTYPVNFASDAELDSRGFDVETPEHALALARERYEDGPTELWLDS